MASQSESSSNLYRPFGSLPNHIAQSTFGQINPLLRGFSLSGGSDRFQSRLADSHGPLADFIRSVQGFGPEVPGQAQQLGSQIAGYGQQGYDQLRGQISQSLAALPQFQQASASAVPLAQQAAQDAFSPIRSRALFQQTAQNVLEPIRQAAAARGLEGSGAAQQREEGTLRDLGLGFAQNDQQNQQAALQGLQGSALNAAQLSSAGVPLAQAQLGAIPQIQQALAQRFQLPMEAAGSLLNLYLAGQAPGLQALGATSQFPVGQSSKGLGVLSCLPDDTEILTPKGPVCVRDLNFDDLIWSLDDHGGLVAAPIIGIASRDVPLGHTFIRVVFNDGTAEASPLHPLADGRPFRSLEVGAVFTGPNRTTTRTIIALDEIPATTKTTRDLLVDSESGLYFIAPGLACASTLDLRHIAAGEAA